MIGRVQSFILSPTTVVAPESGSENSIDHENIGDSESTFWRSIYGIIYIPAPVADSFVFGNITSDASLQWTPHPLNSGPLSRVLQMTFTTIVDSLPPVDNYIYCTQRSETSFLTALLLYENILSI